MQALEANLDANMAGQMLARRTIEKALATNIERHSNFSKDAYIVNPYFASIGESIGESLWGRAETRKQVPRPLFMHFSGPTGVGKSLMADIIAESILAERDAAKQLCGKLLLQMHQYSSRHPAHVEDHTRAIRKMVAEQLYHCPRSVIIFDEIQRAPEELLDNVIDIFDTAGGAPALLHPPHQTPVNTRH